MVKSEVSSAAPRKLINPGSRTVQVTWKLPARLRKPIRHQLAKERAKKRQMQSIIRFERRPLNTRALMTAQDTDVRQAGGIKLPRHRVFNRGAEHHTGDTYKQSRPRLKMAAPPYLGRTALQNFAAPALADLSGGERRSKPDRRVAPVKSSRVAARITRMDFNKDQLSHAWRGRKIVGQRRAKTQTSIPLSYERDVPVDWSGKDNVEVGDELFVQPKSVSSVRKPRIVPFLPFSFSIWPKFLSFGKRSAAASVKKKSEQGLISG